jgi:hypothetical protein
MYTALLVSMCLQSAPDIGEQVARLNHRSYRVREEAQQSLYRLGWGHIKQLDAAREGATEPEVRKRLEVICAGLRAERIRWAQDLVDSRYGPDHPMIDALWMCPFSASLCMPDAQDSSYYAQWRWAQHRKFYGYLYEAMQERQPGDLRRFPEFRKATREMLVQGIYEGWLTQDKADVLVMWMWAQDNNWWIRTSRSSPDPFWWPGVMPQKGFHRNKPVMPPSD